VAVCGHCFRAAPSQVLTYCSVLIDSSDSSRGLRTARRPWIDEQSSFKLLSDREFLSRSIAAIGGGFHDHALERALLSQHAPYPVDRVQPMVRLTG
jgi:hypothetical protein